MHDRGRWPLTYQIQFGLMTTVIAVLTRYQTRIPNSIKRRTHSLQRFVKNPGTIGQNDENGNDAVMNRRNANTAFS